jgi:hypothetical protein
MRSRGREADRAAAFCIGRMMFDVLAGRCVAEKGNPKGNWVREL